MQSMSNGYTKRAFYTETQLDIPKEYVINSLQAEYPYLLELQRIFNEIHWGEVTVTFQIRDDKAEKMEFYNEKRSWMMHKPSLVENLQVKDNIDSVVKED